jgi:peptidoglycan hydrolase CwlO-like protein
MNLKNVSDFLLELENLKAGMGMSKRVIPDEIRLIILERKQNELKRQTEQVEKEIQKDIEDLFDCISLKQANIETLNGINAYLQEELRKVEEHIGKIKAKATKSA